MLVKTVRQPKSTPAGSASDKYCMHAQPTARAVTHSAARDDRAATPGPLACLTVDVEEYFHAEVFAASLGREQWSRMRRRAAPFVERLADLLQRHESRATFFVLGWMVERMAPLLRYLASQGHEIACHGNSHDHLARMTPQTLRADLRHARGRIEDALGIRLRGYRAPTFSLTRATAWALDVIIEAGFDYDASIFPIRHDRYGVPDAPVVPFWAVAPSGARILEFPPLALDCGPLRVPVGGGGYLRLLPGAVLRRCVARRLRRRQAVMIYVHPWELDADQPRLKVGRLAQWRHRVNLGTSEAKIDRLLAAFRFDTARNVLERVRLEGDLPVFGLSGEGR
jgi:polysaccharide deacetylase family protein (PEP-CTERM system associated)